METGVVKGPWSEEEDEKLVSYIKKSGHGHWEALARKAGLNRTGKSCRLRWLNYLRPGIRRGNISRQEQLIILQLHSRWGNRWAKIAECLPGRSDNEIKNYWRTRVQKQAKHLRCDVNSHQFRQIMHHIWLPQLAERVQTQPESSPTIRQEFESQPLISDKLSRNSNARSHSDPTPVEAYNPWNENVSEGSNPRAWLGAGEDGDAYQPNRHERIVPCKDFRFESDQEGELATAWYDHDNYSLENLLNDEGMMSSCQQLLLDDHQA